MFVYELSGCGFESRCSQFNFRYCVSFEATIACRFDLKRVPDMIIIYSHFFYRLCCYQANKRLFHRSFWSIKTNCKIIVFQVKLPVLFLYLQKYWGIWSNRKRLENNVEQQRFEQTTVFAVWNRCFYLIRSIKYTRKYWHLKWLWRHYDCIFHIAYCRTIIVILFSQDI